MCIDLEKKVCFEYGLAIRPNFFLPKATLKGFLRLLEVRTDVKNCPLTYNHSAQNLK